MKKRTKTPKKRSAKKRNLGRYASSIEKYCATQLKEHKISFDYEEHTFELMEKFNYPNKYFKMTPKRKDMADRTGRVVLPIKYTPDFIGDGFIIECKGRANESFPMRWKLFKRFINRCYPHVTLYKPQNQKECDQVIELIIKNK